MLERFVLESLANALECESRIPLNCRHTFATPEFNPGYKLHSSEYAAFRADWGEPRRNAVRLYCGSCNRSCPASACLPSEMALRLFYSRGCVVHGIQPPEEYTSRCPAPSRTLLEYVLASVSASLMFAGFLTGGAIVAVSLYWIVILLNLLLWAIGVAVTFPAAKIAWAVGWLFSALAWLLMTFLSIDEVREQLFPGAHSRFHELATVHRVQIFTRIAAVLCIAAGLALAWW